ncbi:MAG: domain containing protein [Acidimicrobiales bacterium]|nr:domain containing protein [Acidimicrobiales bacterium]
MSGRIGQRLGAAALAVVALVASAGVPAGAATPDQVSVSAVPATTTPFVRDGQVRAIAVFPTRVVLGGDFTSVRNRAAGSPVVTRRFLLAFDRQTGLVDTAFVPVLDGPVEALAPGPDGASVLVGGSFDKASGRVVGGLTRIALASGAPLAGFTATTDGNVDTLKVIGTTAYVGGTFGKINGLVRTRLAAVSTVSGAVSPSLTVPVTASQNASAPSRVEKLAVDPAGTRLVIAGNFLQVAGQPRSQIAMIDLTTSPASLATWSTVRFNRKQCAQTYNSDIRDLEVSPDGSYFVAGTTGAWGGTASMCDTASRWELARSGPGQQPSWVQFTGGDTITSVAVTGGGVYLGGHFRWMNNALTPVGDVAGPGAVVRQGLAALDPRTGAPLAWNPTRQLGYGVLDMVPTDDGLYIGHDTDLVGHLVNSRVAFFPTVGGKPLPAFKDPTLPTMLFTADGAGRVARRAFNGVAAPSAPVGVATSEAWGQARGIFAAGGWIYSGWSDGVLRRRTFDGGQFGPVASAQSWWDTRGIRSAMYTGGRLYYTIAGDNELWMRTFDPVSGVVGTLKTSVSGPVNGIAWRSVTGMTYAGGKLVVTTTDGYLRVANATFGISGAPSVTNQHGVSGPNIDGGRWAFVDLFTTPVG